MNIFIGLLIGIAIGAFQIFLLDKFIRGLTSIASSDNTTGKTKTSGLMIAGMSQLLLPFAVLVVVAFLYRDALLWAGIGAASSLLILGIIKALLGKKGK